MKWLDGIRIAEEVQPLPKRSRSISAQYRDEILRHAESALAQDLHLPLLSEGHTLGMAARREAAKAFAMAICAEDTDKRFCVGLADAVWAIGKEDDWRMIAGKNGCIDTCAAQTAALLAQCLYYCREALDSVSKKIVPFIEKEIERRVLQPLAQYPKDNFLTDDGTEMACSAILETAVFLGKVSGMRWMCVQKAARLLELAVSSEKYFGSISLRDCMQRLGAICDAAQMLRLLTNGKLDLTKKIALTEACHLPSASYIGDDWFANAGDDGMRPREDVRLWYHIGRFAECTRLTRFAAFLLQDGQYRAQAETSLYQRVCFLRESMDLQTETPSRSALSSAFLLQYGFMMARSRTLYCALTMGSGIHGDAGDITLFAHGKPVLVDIGETDRPEWHNVPVINGILQECGALAEDPACREDTGYTALSLSIAPAYDERARLSSWQRTVLLLGDQRVRLIDMFDFMQKGRAEFRFITPYAPMRCEKGFLLGDVLLAWEGAQLSARVDNTQLRTRIFGDRVYRLTFSMTEDVIRGSVTFTFETVPNGD